MNIRDIRQHLRQFFEGKSSGKGGRLIDDWYHFYDDRSEKLQNLNSVQKEELRKEIFENVRKSAGISGKSRQWNGVSNPSADGRRTWPYKMAAGFAVLLLAMIPVFLFTAEPQPPETVEYNTSSNPAGQSSRLTLTDGSTVWLSANSTLRYPETFEGTAETGTREVMLEGEAFFDVAPNPAKPFIVHSENLRTQVLGTSFNIRAFEDEEDIKITVATGKVTVGRTDQNVDSTAAENEPVASLEPDQQLVFNRLTRQAETQPVNSQLYTSWKDGELSFENHTFGEIAGRLEMWYGVQIHFEDPDIRESRFRITFQNSSLEHALNMLQAIEEFEFEIKPEEKQVWIK